MKISKLILMIITVTLASCAANSLSTNAMGVQVSPNQPGKDCKFLDTITSSQGNFFTGGFTSNKNLQKGAYNQLRNDTAQLGGNYVQVLSNQAGNTGGMGANGGAYQQTNYNVTGSAYRCP